MENDKNYESGGRTIVSVVVVQVSHYSELLAHDMKTPKNKDAKKPTNRRKTAAASPAMKAAAIATAPTPRAPPAPPKSLPRLQEIIGKYHAPVPPNAPVGSLVPNLTILTAEVNKAWKLSSNYKTIDGTWTVIYLAGDIDLRTA